MLVYILMVLMLMDFKEIDDFLMIKDYKSNCKKFNEWKDKMMLLGVNGAIEEYI